MLVGVAFASTARAQLASTDPESLLAELSRSSGEPAAELRGQFLAYLERLGERASEPDPPNQQAIRALAYWIYRPWSYDSAGGLGIDTARGLALARAARTAVARLPDEAERAQFDFCATVATALFARRCGEDRESVESVDRWLDTWRDSARVEVRTQYAGTLGLIAGESARALGEWDEAERYLVAADRALPAQDVLARRDLCAAWAKLYLELGLPDVAYEWWLAEDALLTQIAGGSDRAQLVAQFDHARSLADIYIDSARFERARDALRKELAKSEFYAARPVERSLLGFRLGVALRSASTHGSKDDEEGRALLVAARDEPALAPLERMHAALASTQFALERDRDLGAAQTQLDAARALFDAVYPEAVRARWGPENRPPRHWGLLNAYAARIARLRGDAGAPDEANLARLEASFRDFLVQWRSTPVRAGGVGFLYADYRRSVLGELVHELIARHGDTGKAEALERVIEAQTCGTIGRRLELAPATVADVRAKLRPSNGGVLVLLPIGNELHVFALDGERVEHGLVGNCERLSELLRRRPTLGLPRDRSAAAAEKSRASLAKAGLELTRELLPEAIRARVAQWRTWLVVGSELLDGVAFETLSLDGKRLLGLEVAIEYLPSIPLGVALAAAAPAPHAWSRPLVFVGAPSTGARSQTAWPSAEPFVLAESELAKVCAPFGAGALRCIGQAATREKFLGLDLSDTAVLHVLCHGIHDPKRERPAGLLFAETDDALGELWSTELESGPKVVPPVVILSACGAGRGSERLGEDALNHLGGAFLERGAVCVLLARRDLELNATLALSAVLHRRLAAGDAPAEALRVARVELAKSKEFGDPFYFTTLQAFGLGHAPVFAAR